MNTLRFWLIVLLLAIAGFVSIGMFRPSESLSSEFLVKKSVSTSFMVLTEAANIVHYYDGIASYEPLVSNDSPQNNRYRLRSSRGSNIEELEAEMVEFKNLESFTYQFSKPGVISRSTYTLLPTRNGTSVRVTHVVMPQHWWNRSWLPMVLGTVIREQSRINDALIQIIESSPESIIGDWVSTDSAGVQQMFSFKSNGTVDWKVAVGDEIFPLNNITYRRESSLNPELLDFSGFTSGPLRGLTLFGILDMSRRDTLVFDAEAGLEDDDGVRPRTFSSSAITYVRTR